MSSQVSISVIPRKGKRLSTQLPLKFTFAELAAEEAANPGTLGAIQTTMTTILGLYQGANKVQDGNLGGWTLSLSTPSSAVVPSIQTHEERVVATFECQFPNAVTEIHKVSVPTPDLTTDWPFPAGADRVYQADFASQFSTYANGWISIVTFWLLTYGLDGVTTVTPLYADLVGRNS